jgi:type I restriction enzyme S subunit
LHALKSAPVFAQLEAGALGATIKGINIRDLKRALIPVPPRDEQEAIAGHLDREAARVNALVQKIGDAIERLSEYRTALISAAVTGKIDIRKEGSK